MDSLGPIIVFIAGLAWGVIHSLLAALGFKRWILRKAGMETERFYRLGFNLFAGISLLPIFALLILFPGKVLYRIPPPWLFLTALVQMAAVLLVVKAMLQTGAGRFLGFSQLAGGPVEPPRLIRDGAYRHIRHPLYTSGLIFIWLSPVMTESLLALNLVFTLYILAGARLEERKLEAEFGATYQEYRRRTPSFIPFVRRKS